MVTPVGGWLYGEWAHNKEKEIIAAGGKVWGSEITGDIALFFLDPVDRIGTWINRLFKRRVVKTGFLSVTQFSSSRNGNYRADKGWQVHLTFIY